MLTERNYTEKMSNKEILYTVASDFIDEIAIRAMKCEKELFSNIKIAELLYTTAEYKIRYEQYRKGCYLNGAYDTEMLKFYREDYLKFKDVCWQIIFYDFKKAPAAK